MSPITPLPYPIVPTFEHWKFPHNNLPSQWKHTSLARVRFTAASNTEHAVRERDKSCRITNATDETEVAHFCPKAQNDWFEINGMHVYNAIPSLPRNHRLNDQRNTTLLRNDLHAAMDHQNVGNGSYIC